MKIDKFQSPIFIIGAVARATGIPVETLRVWERRYRVVTPHRDPDSNKRYYTTEDICRLKLVKQLVDRGHAISSVAGLDDTVLRDRLDVHADAEHDAPVEDGTNVMVCGEMLPHMVKEWDLEDAPLNLTGCYESDSDFESAALSSRPHILVMEMPFLLLDSLENLAGLAARTAARRGGVIYGYGPEHLVEAGRKLGLWMVKGPISRQTFTDLCRLPEKSARDGLVLSGAEDPAIPPPRYDSATLARIATTLPSIRCECPQHLADLVFRIHAFERYSADCQNRNEQDAAIHANLRICAGKARSLFEDALAFLIAMEGLDVNPAEHDMPAGNEDAR